MLLRIAALGALGYADCRYLAHSRERSPDAADLRLAGGPPSDLARVQSGAPVPVPADA